MDKKSSFSVYLGLTAITLCIMTLVGGWIVYMMHPSLMVWSHTGAYVVEILLTEPLWIGWAMWLYMVGVTVLPIEHPILLRLSNRGLYVFFPVLILLGKIFRISSDTISQSLINLINYLVWKQKYRVEPERLLLLTPHCIQNHDCIHKVTTDVTNCKRCGRCQVQDLLAISERYGCHFIVVTGGTLARMMIKKIRPQAIIAIACERDLVSGMADVFPIPVIGVLNERPCGPCYNTRVDTLRIEEVVERLLYGHHTK